MKPQDIIEQLVGEITDWDQHATMAFTLYGCSKFDKHFVSVDFGKGILEVYSDDNCVIKTYAIRAELLPIE